VIERRADMAQIATTVTINRPRDEVFAYVTDLGKADEWTTALVSRSIDGQIARGTTGLDVFRVGGRRIEAPWEVTGFRPPESMTIEFRGTFAATSEFTFEESDAGTVLRCVTDLHPRGVWRVLAPLLSREGRRTDREQFQRVREILEGTAHADERPRKEQRT
jgi:carbon monoxide dehydrogenase subunit G